MTAFQIRLIAIVTMVIDHVGLFFFPQYIILRLIGRLSFPLFAWLIANGARHTSNISKYIKRLFILACVSQVPFTIANQHNGSSFWYFNVLFTLCLGLAVIWAKQKGSKPTIATVLIIALATAFYFNTDYGVSGVLSVVFFYLYFKSPIRLFIAQAIILSLLPILLLAERAFEHRLGNVSIYDFNELLGLFSLIMIYLYNNKEGIKAKYLFYIFYPMQYIAICILQQKY